MSFGPPPGYGPPPGARPHTCGGEDMMLPAKPSMPALPGPPTSHRQDPGRSDAGWGGGLREPAPGAGHGLTKAGLEPPGAGREPFGGGARSLHGGASHDPFGVPDRRGAERFLPDDHQVALPPPPGRAGPPGRLGARRARAAADAVHASSPRAGAGGGKGAGAVADDGDIPPGAKGANFRTLQEMIARGIHDSEASAQGMRTDIDGVGGDADYQRQREKLLRRREEEAVTRQRERDAAKQKRRQEEEARRRKMMDEMEREERETQRARQEKEASARHEAACRRELKAATRIQAHVRGRRSRAGKPTTSPTTCAVLHSEPFVN